MRPRLLHYSSNWCYRCRCRLHLSFWGSGEESIILGCGFATLRRELSDDEKGGTIIVHACWAGKKELSFRQPLSFEKACINRNKPCIKISVPNPSILFHAWYQVSSLISFVFRRTGNVFDLPLQFFGKYTELRYDWDKRGKDAPRILKAELAEKQMEDEWLDLQSEFKSSEEYWKVESWMWWQYDSQLGLERAATAALGKLIWYAKLKENWKGCEGSWNHKGV